MHLAEAWVKLLNDREKAKEILEEAEERAEESINYMNLAGAWLKLFNDSEKAREMLEEAESRDEDA